MFVEKVCQVSPFPPLLLVLLILFIVQQHSRQPLSTGLSLHQVGACRDHRRADLSKNTNYACGHFQSTFYVT